MSDQLNLEQHSKLPQIFREKNLAENCFRNKHVRSLYLMKKHLIIRNMYKLQEKGLHALHLSSMKFNFFQLVCFEKIISI